MHDATRRGRAHRLEAFGKKVLYQETRYSSTVSSIGGRGERDDAARPHLPVALSLSGGEGR
jgi:hypothetical protein